jgi:hypothetical protein
MRDRFELRHPTVKGVAPGESIEAYVSVLRRTAEKKREAGKMWTVDAGWPAKMEVELDLAGVDEGSAALLHGVVRAIQPDVCIETGTHKGRSTQAIASALVRNERGHLWTLDLVDFGVRDSGALDKIENEYVTLGIGKSPEVLEEFFGKIGPIDFAYLDGDHTEEGLTEELWFVVGHMADECTMLIDNSRDDMWEGVRRAIDTFRVSCTSPLRNVSLPTMCGMDILHLRKP